MILNPSPRQPPGLVLTNNREKRSVGVYIPVDATDDNVTVFWRGNVGKNTFISILGCAEEYWGHIGAFQETVVVYGKDKKTYGPGTGIFSLMSVLMDLDFDACRAELGNERGKLVLWANVQQGNMVSLEHGGENIGICFPIEFFHARTVTAFALRTVIAFAITHTMVVEPMETARVLREVHYLVHKTPKKK
jgi:hypothetical protein